MATRSLDPGRDANYWRDVQQSKAVPEVEEMDDVPSPRVRIEQAASSGRMRSSRMVEPTVLSKGDRYITVWIAERPDKASAPLSLFNIELG